MLREHRRARNAGESSKVHRRLGEGMMEDFYATFVRELPRDEWGHPVLPTPEKIRRREYGTSLLTLQIELVKMQQWVRANRRARAPALRGARHRR